MSLIKLAERGFYLGKTIGNRISDLKPGSTKRMRNFIEVIGKRGITDEMVASAESGLKRGMETTLNDGAELTAGQSKRMFYNWLSMPTTHK